MLTIDPALINTFERQLDPQNLQASAIQAELIGFGEISAIFTLKTCPGVVFKRMPMFNEVSQANKYLHTYHDYCTGLKQAGLQLPADNFVVVEKSERLTVVYFAQQQYSQENIANKLIHTLSKDRLHHLVQKIITAIYGVWNFNRQHKNNLELALDAQLSNWVYNSATDELVYLDTSTPLFKRHGVEQLDPELLLTSAPGFGRAIIRKFFLQGVMERYYSERAVNIDLAANLYKEQRPDLIPLFLEEINRRTASAITAKELAAYYREDKFIWQLFLALRKMDRWLHRYVYHQPYQFILPGQIKR